MAYKSKAQADLDAALAELETVRAELAKRTEQVEEMQAKLVQIDTEVEDTLNQRNAKYGGSFYQTDRAIQAMTGGNAANLQGLLESGQLANWVMVISKANRAVYSPEHEDHMRDIAGYATLNLRIQRGDLGE